MNFEELIKHIDSLTPEELENELVESGAGKYKNNEYNLTAEE